MPRRKTRLAKLQEALGYARMERMSVSATPEDLATLSTLFEAGRRNEAVTLFVRAATASWRASWLIPVLEDLAREAASERLASAERAASSMLRADGVPKVAFGEPLYFQKVGEARFPLDDRDAAVSAILEGRTVIVEAPARGTEIVGEARAHG